MGRYEYIGIHGRLTKRPRGLDDLLDHLPDRNELGLYLTAM